MARKAISTPGQRERINPAWHFSSMMVHWADGQRLKERREDAHYSASCSFGAWKHEQHVLERLH